MLDDVQQARFILHRQRFLEFIEQRDCVAALRCLRTDIAATEQTDAVLHSLAAYISSVYACARSCLLTCVSHVRLLLCSDATELRTQWLEAADCRPDSMSYSFRGTAHYYIALSLCSLSYIYIDISVSLLSIDITAVV